MLSTHTLYLDGSDQAYIIVSKLLDYSSGGIAVSTHPMENGLIKSCNSLKKSSLKTKIFPKIWGQEPRSPWQLLYHTGIQANKQKLSQKHFLHF